MREQISIDWIQTILLKQQEIVAKALRVLNRFSDPFLYNNSAQTIVTLNHLYVVGCVVYLLTASQWQEFINTNTRFFCR